MTCSLGRSENPTVRPRGGPAGRSNPGGVGGAFCTARPARFSAKG